MILGLSIDRRVEARAQARIVRDVDAGLRPSLRDMNEAVPEYRWERWNVLHAAVEQHIDRWREDPLVQFALAGRLGAVPRDDFTDQARL